MITVHGQSHCKRKLFRIPEKAVYQRSPEMTLPFIENTN